MDMQMVQQVVDWVQNNVGDSVSKTELMQKAESSSLPAEAKSALAALPEGMHDRNDVISMVRDKMMAGMGSMAGGAMGGMGGGMGGGYK